MRTGNKKRFRTLLAFLLAVTVLAGCSTPEYEKVDVGRYAKTSAEAENEPETEAENEPAAKAESQAEPEQKPESEETMAPIGTDVKAQDPVAETLGGTETKAVGSETAVTVMNGHVVTVDAGYQAKGNSEKEPIGPSSETMRAKMSEGSTGTATGVRENELALAVAKKLKAELEQRGYQVVMTRESNDVNISNAERAEIANKNNSDIFVRLHANSMENSGVYGALTMCMTAQNPYNADLYEDSHRLSKLIVDQICAQTGTKNRGVQEVDNSGAINWSKVPVSDVAMGFLSNPDEDRWLQDESYQDKIVTGIANAVDSYFSGS